MTEILNYYNVRINVIMYVKLFSTGNQRSVDISLTLSPSRYAHHPSQHPLLSLPFYNMWCPDPGPRSLTAWISQAGLREEFPQRKPFLIQVYVLKTFCAAISNLSSRSFCCASGIADSAYTFLIAAGNSESYLPYTKV